MVRIEVKDRSGVDTDLCRDCYDQIAEGEPGFGDDVEHPPYSDGEYECARCGKMLDDEVDA